MSCYLRHLKPFLAEVGITLEASNRKQVDKTIRQVIDASDASCPETWKKLKPLLSITKERQELLAKLKSAL